MHEMGVQNIAVVQHIVHDKSRCATTSYSTHLCRGAFEPMDVRDTAVGADADLLLTYLRCIVKFAIWNTDMQYLV